MQVGRSNGKMRHVSFGILAEGRDITLAAPGWKPAEILWEQDVHVPYNGSVFSMLLVMIANNSSLSDDEREAWACASQAFANQKDAQCVVLLTPDYKFVGIAGYLMFSDSGIGVITSLCICDDWRRRKIGSAFFAFLCKDVLKKANMVTLSVNETNAAAIAFWETVPGIWWSGSTTSPPKILVHVLAALAESKLTGRFYWYQK
jgi:ribosomal protein S18 acetylase RimI-like enzyme